MSAAGRELYFIGPERRVTRADYVELIRLAGMLDQARKRSDIEWVLGDLASVSWEREFDLVVMSGHAFQVFVEDDELRTALAAIHSALTEDGRFAFEIRNPLVRE